MPHEEGVSFGRKEVTCAERTSIAELISIDSVRLRFIGTPWSLVRVYLTNLIMNVCSTGLAYYHTRLRSAKYIAAHVVIDGDPSSLVSSDHREPPREQMRFLQGLEAVVAASYL